MPNEVDFPYVDNAESIVKLVTDYIRLRSITGNSLPASIVFALQSAAYCLSTTIQQQHDGDLIYKVQLLQLTHSINEDITDIIGEFILNNRYEIQEFKTTFDRDYYNDISLLLLENLEEYFSKLNKLGIL